MPIYEYSCDNEHSFEINQRMADPPVTACEVCGAPAKRVFHPPAVHFKGKGFYTTDYGTRKRQREKEAAGDGGSSAGGGDGAKSEAAGDKKESKETPASSGS